MGISRFGFMSAVLLTAAALPASCSSTPSAQRHMASVSGTFVTIGGPAPGSPRPTAGVVTFTNSDGRPTDVNVGFNGHFEVDLTEGEYSLSGRSSNGGNECSGGNVDLTTNSPPPVQVACQVP